MRITRFFSCCLLLILAYTLLPQYLLAATPVNGQSDCGLIQGSTFYSDQYAPPYGTPAISGSCKWVRQSNTICATRNYGGTNYDLYPHKYICNAPLDDNIGLLFLTAGFFGVYWIKRKPQVIL